MHLKLESIILDERYYPRSHVDWHTVLRYKSALLAGAQFPPVTVGKRGKAYYLLDGWHRYRANRKIGSEKITAIITPVPQRLWFCEAVRLNIRHGIALNYQERLQSYMRLKRDGLPVDELQTIFATPIEDMEKATAQRAVWLSPNDLRPLVAKTPLMTRLKERGPEWLTEKASVIEQEQKSLNGVSEKGLLRQVIVMLENDFLPTLDEETTELIKQLKNRCEQWLLTNVSSAA
jgi:ParB-like nuclease domain